DEAAGSYNLTLTNTGALTNPSALSFTVSPAAPDHLVFSGASSATAGVNSASITATLKDQFGNSATRGSDVVITPASSSAAANKAFTTTGATSQATFTITAGSSTASFRYYDETAATYNLTLTNNAALTNPAPLWFTVGAAAADHIVLP